ncbi:hypothetical protein BGZ76_001283 [Entomortierella beljakovae]|nr:hypothetical protein BGZ76_001283 [Entomortierella beljakovae]
MHKVDNHIDLNLWFIYAHSSEWPAITRSEHVLNLHHEILPRITTDPFAKRSLNQLPSVASDIISRLDTFRIQFSAFNSTFHLYLEPNTELIHPDSDLGPNISHDDIKAFKGVVLQDEKHSDRKWERAATTSQVVKRSIEHMLHEEGVLGWARVMVEHDTDSSEGLILRGAFMANDDTYHINTRHVYHVQKRSDDALPPEASLGSNLIIYRDSDLYKPTLNPRKKRGLETNNVSCGSDHMLNKTAGYIESVSSHDYYYPPDLSATTPMLGDYDMASSPSWMNVLSPLAKRSLTIRAVGPNPVPAGCPVNRLVNYMGVAADCAYVRSYGGQAAARAQIFSDFNTASAIYESTFNVALGVIALNISPESCPSTPVQGQEWNQDCSVDYTIDKRLSDFSNWRGQSPRVDDGAGLWHLMTKCNSGAVVGIAWTKALCQMKSQAQVVPGEGTQYTAGTGVSSITPNEWMVVAHEIGHGFGAAHDCATQSCSGCCPLSATVCDAGGRYIMNPTEQTATKVFSPCSIKTICNTIQGLGQCLKPPGTREVQSGEVNICGNGIKETGEDCDCGSAEECANDPCCNGTTCKFNAGAVCDDLNDDCCQSCQLKPAGQVCRVAISECDVQEVCSGTSAACPADVRLDNETPCTGSGNATGLQCANGVCTSRDLQCLQQDREGVTKACGASNSCDLLCNDPSGGALTCAQIPGAYFIDGTPCGFGGTCSKGQCDYNGASGVLNWAKRNLKIVIPVAVVVGLILICCIWACCCSGFFDKKRQRKRLRKPTGRRPTNSNGIQNAQHGGQQYPMSNLPPPPPPVYNDPSILTRGREEAELQRALEESRQEYERRSQSVSGMAQHTARGSEALAPLQGASVVATPPINGSAVPIPPFNSYDAYPVSTLPGNTSAVSTPPVNSYDASAVSTYPGLGYNAPLPSTYPANSYDPFVPPSVPSYNPFTDQNNQNSQDNQNNSQYRPTGLV